MPKVLSFRVTSDHLLLCVFLSLLWGVTDSSKPGIAATTTGISSTTETTVATTTTTQSTAPPTTKSPPGNVEEVKVLTQNDSSITLDWNKVGTISTYSLQYDDKSSSNTDIINTADERTSVTHVVSSLTAGTKYNFTLFTEFEGLNSTGYTFQAVTAPENVEDVKVLTQNESSITLMWDKVDNISTYWLEYHNNGYSNEVKINASDQDTSVTHVVSPLTAGTKYNFTLFTEFEGVNSSGYTFQAATAPENVEDVKVLTQNESSITLMWDKVDNISTYWLEYHNNGYSNEVKISASDQDTSVTHVVSPLTAGTKYNFTLFTEFEGVNSSGYTFQAATAPENVADVKVLTQNESSITLMWDKVDNISTYWLEYHNNVYSNEVQINASDQETSVTHVVSPLTAGTKYNFTLFTVFEGVISSGYTFQNVTAPENVEDVKVLTQNESSITLMWDKVDNISTYWLEYHNNVYSNEVQINASDQETSVTHVVSPLTAGTKYNFTLFTVFEGVISSGYTFQNVTAPENVEDVKVLTQNESSITLMWDKVDNISIYWLQYDNNGSSNTDIINESDQGTSVTHVVSPLTAGTKYDFTLFTVFEGVNSSGYTFQNVTVPENVEDVKVLTQNESSITLTWDKVNNISTYWLEYHNNSYSNEVKINASDQGTSVTHVVFPLTAGTFYYFTLFTVFEGVNSSGYTFQNVTAPENVEDVKVLTQNESSITLTWDKVDNISTYWLEYHNNSYSNEVKINASDQGTSVTHVVSPLTAGTFYYFTLFTVFERVNSSGYTFQNVTAPENVEDVKVLTQNESSITLMWDKVDNISTYWLEYHNNSYSNKVKINASDPGTSVTHVVSPLTAGTKYVFALFTVFEGVNSSEKTFQNFTVPPAVSSVSVTERSVTSITLAWSVDVDKDWSYFLQMNGESLSLPRDNSKDVVSHSFTSLRPGTEYLFSVITEFCGLNSTAYEDFTVTAIDCASVNWHVTNSSIQGMIDGLFTNATATVKSQVHLGMINGSNVTFTGLYPGATYEVFLVYEQNSSSFNQCLPEPPVTTNPPNLDAGCEYWAAGYSVNVAWNKPDGVWTAVEVNVSGETHNKPAQDGKQNMIIRGFLPARTYEVSVASLSGNRRSDPYVFQCLTDPRGVIAGSVFAVLLFCVLVFLVLFILLKRPDIISGKVPFIVGSKLSNKKPKAISVAKFPDHFYQLSVDDNRGFSQEYESLIPVGTEQTRKEALLPENKARNRFNNVLPYDWCRVKLSTSNPNMTSDYINANYMPGYNSNREYIATQGPLPSTVNDFWRMIWEQRVKGIVMVTNCTEGGRTKCEHYWPADSKPCLYGGLSVTMHSERQEPNWTLREFRLKHSNTSEERTVRHFHFTAWPDHGVPQGTEVLIQFRELVRQHIEREGGGAPTVVHCSAGVGRTGTIIALDVLLQQLDQDKAVGINAFVHKMRLSRPHMVQTESQYVFLHQCIMDRLQPHDTTEEHIYENTDTIYVNATALRELHSSA